MKSILRLTLALGLSLIPALTVWGAPADDEQPARPLNLIIIQTDEHNFRTLGCYREHLPLEQARIWGEQAIVETPCIDSIAASGAICTSYYATSPVCTPSRASFFTGYYPHRTGAPGNDLPLNNEMVTFAEVLKRQGYATGYAGKWHLDGPGKPQWQPERQFGFSDNRFMFNRGHWKKFELTPDGPRVAATKNGKPTYAVDGATAESFSTDWLTSRAIDFIEANSDRPFCFHLSLPDPHGPNTVRSPYDTMYTNMVIKPPLTYSRTTSNPKWAPGMGRGAAGKFQAEQMAQYFGMVRCIDDNVGRILATLDNLGLQERTAVVVTADHGDLCYEHGRLNKGNPYEGSARIPMIVSVPGRVPAKTLVHQALGTVDFSPTILSLLGHQPIGEMDGRDASELFLDRSSTWRDLTILRNSGLRASWLAAVSDRYKLVVSVEDEPWLFDMQSDPDELTNAFGQPGLTEVAREYAQAILDYGRQFQDPFVTQEKIDQQLRQIVSN